MINADNEVGSLLALEELDERRGKLFSREFVRLKVSSGQLFHPPLSDQEQKEKEKEKKMKMTNLAIVETR